MTHFLQSPPWEAFQHELGKKTVTASDNTWSYMAIIEPSRAASRIYAPYGPIVQSSDALKQATQSLVRDARKAGVAYIRVEPTGNVSATDLAQQGYQKVAASQPEHTWCIDVTTSTTDELIANMSQPNRNSYRNYQKKGLTIHTSTNPDDITVLTTLLRSVASRNAIRTHSDGYFHTQATTLMQRDAATLYYVLFEGQPIAAALVYDSDTTRYYAHAAASYAHRKLNPGAIIVSSLIVDAKNKGLQTVDLYGITDSEDPNHPWAGFTKFKKSFGGYPVDYVGRWELPVNHARYRFYRLGLAIYRHLRK